MTGNIPFALAMTGLVLLLAFIVMAFWVSESSRGWARRGWHRPVAALLGGLSAAFFIAAAWVGIL